MDAMLEFTEELFDRMNGAHDTLLPDVTSQFRRTLHGERRHYVGELELIRREAMRQTVAMQQRKPLRALFDDSLVSLTPGMLHGVFALNSQTYDVYLSQVWQQIEQLRQVTHTSLRWQFTKEFENVKTACELACESRRLAPYESMQLKQAVQALFDHLVGEIDRQASAAWRRCYRSVPWEQRMRRWARHLN